MKSVEQNGQALEFTPNTYLSVTGLKAGATLRILFDMTVVPHFKNGKVALSCGPLALAQESGLGTVGEALQDLDFSRQEARPPYRALFVNRHGQRLCDYASADRRLSPDVTLQVWLPYL